MPKLLNYTQGYCELFSHNYLDHIHLLGNQTHHAHIHISPTQHAHMLSAKPMPSNFPTKVQISITKLWQLKILSSSFAPSNLSTNCKILSISCISHLLIKLNTRYLIWNFILGEHFMNACQQLCSTEQLWGNTVLHSGLYC